MRLIWNDPFCVENKFRRHNSLLIDCQPEKVQNYLWNSIINREYNIEDTVDNCEDIRDWLRTHTDYKTPKLLPEIDSAESDETELTNEK